MATKWKNNRHTGMLLILLGAALAATVLCSAYPYFRGRAEAQLLRSAEREEAQTSEATESSEANAFLADEEFFRYLLSSVYYMNYESTADMDAYEYFTQNYDMDRLSVAEQESVREAARRLMKNMRNQYTMVQSTNNYTSYAVGADKEYGGDQNLRSAIYGDSEAAQQYYSAGIVIAYDSRGIPSVRESWNMNMDENSLLGYLQSVSMNSLLEDNGMEYGEAEYDTEVYTYDEETGTMYPEDPYEIAAENDSLLRTLPAPKIQNATFAFGIHGSYDVYEENTYWNDYWRERDAYTHSGLPIMLLGVMAAMFLLALALQNVPALGLRSRRLFCLPTELILFLGLSGVGAFFGVVLYDFMVYSMNGELVQDLQSIGFGNAAGEAATALIWFFWFCCAFCCYWLTASLLPYITHPIRTLRERMLCVSICRWFKNLWLRFWHWATDVELDEKLTRNIWKLIGLNALIVTALCCIWVGGIVGVVIYSILLYILVKKKCKEIQDNYRKLLHMTRTIAEGDLNASAEEDMGVFNPIRDEVASIRQGFGKAVSEEVKSRNMKTELITNVSHDLKTPLTAIITYVDLLKKEDITEEERREYIDTLDRKSQRLKVLIEDLFEVSKATTDNIVMNFEDVDLVNLIKQVRLENEDKIGGSSLDFRWNLPEEKCILSLDPQRTFRIMDNLVQNILKYAMPHSRVYIDMRDENGEVTVSFKNMSAAEMNFSPEEITERFSRGDLSRNTEGSGLGLAIAQSFTELQNGTFRVETDGDLFKVTICWKR